MCLQCYYFKLVDHLTYAGSTISSTKTDVNIHIGKAWSAIDRLLTIGKYFLRDKIKRNFFQTDAELVLLYDCTTRYFIKCFKKSYIG